MLLNRCRWSGALYAKCLLFLLLVVMSGCLQIKQDLTLMPDGSGKLDFSFSIKQDSYVRIIELSGWRTQARFDPVNANTEPMVLPLDPVRVGEWVTGVVAWRGLTTIKADGWIGVRGIGYFYDINQVKIFDPFRPIDLEADLNEQTDSALLPKLSYVYRDNQNDNNLVVKNLLIAELEAMTAQFDLHQSSGDDQAAKTITQESVVVTEESVRTPNNVQMTRAAAVEPNTIDAIDVVGKGNAKLPNEQFQTQQFEAILQATLGGINIHSQLTIPGQISDSAGFLETYRGTAKTYLAYEQLRMALHEPDGVMATQLRRLARAKEASLTWPENKIAMGRVASFHHEMAGAIAQWNAAQGEE